MGKSICSHVVTDKQWFQENMICLLSNAVKYSSEGEVIISITKVNFADLDTINSRMKFVTQESVVENEKTCSDTAETKCNLVI